MKAVLLVLALAGALQAQGPDQQLLDQLLAILTATEAGAKATGSSGMHPTTFVGGGAVFGQSPAGWISYARLMDQKSGTYFFLTEDATPVKGSHPLTLQTSARAGIATIIKEIGRLRIIGIVDGGAATIGTNSGAAASGGTLVSFRVGKAWEILGGFRVMKTQLVNGTPRIYEIGFGRSF